MEVPEVQYVRSGDVHIAYQVMGAGPDLVMTPSGFNHLLVRWELPLNARYLRRLASFSRVTVWDKRGTGLSDRHGDIPSISAQLDDLDAVLDASGARRPALLGLADGAFLSALYAAERPERVGSLVVHGAAPRFAPGEDGLGVSRRFLEAAAEGDSDRLLRVIAAEVADDPATRAWWRRYQASSASPGTVERLLRMWMEVDLTEALQAIRVPTTVIQRLGDLVTPPPNGRAVADLIPGSRYVEVPGGFSTMSGGTEELLDVIEMAVTGSRHSADPDRFLATILFTDIVGSTTAAARMGDAAWRARLDEHDAIIARDVADHGGRLVKSMGDGVLATFDSPARALRCAAETVAGLQARGIEIRAGLHTGECERRGGDVGGLAVHIAARVGALAGAGEVLATGTVRDLVVGSGLEFADRGEHELRGVPGTWRVLALAT